MRRSWPTIWLSSILGTAIGILPAAGSTVASLVGYNEAKRWSKTPERFGKGAIEGVAAPEAANNAAVGGAMVPRSEEHTSELQSLMRSSYAVFRLKKKKIQYTIQ